MRLKFWAISLITVGIVILGRQLNKQYGYDKDSIITFFEELSNKLGIWAIPVFIGVHTVTLALCLPYAIFFEGGASLLFGFFPGVFCVFSAKVLAASLSFWIGRFIFKSSSSAMSWVQTNKHFHVISKGVEQDGWKFVLLARFSPVPSYIINYALAATNVKFFVDFLLPTVLGCLPMILQNTSIISLAGAAVSSASGSKKSEIWSYVFPLMGIMSSVIITFRIRKYSKNISLVGESDEVEESSSRLLTTSQEEDKDVRKRR